MTLYLKTILTILFISVSFNALAAEFMFNAGISQTRDTIVGQNNPPTYKGKSTFYELEYLIQLNNTNAISLFGKMHSSDLTNENGLSTITETIESDYKGFGVKYYSSNLSLSFSTGSKNFSLNATGSVNKLITFEDSAFELGVAYRFRVSRLVGLTVSFHALRAGMDPEAGEGFYRNYDLWEYRASIGLSMIIPSIPSLKDAFSM